jgi:hypothetical protein
MEQLDNTYKVVHDIKRDMDQYRQYMRHILEYVERQKAK